MNLIQAYKSGRSFKRIDGIILDRRHPQVECYYNNKTVYTVKNGFLWANDTLIFISDRAINGQYEFVDKSVIEQLKDLIKLFINQLKVILKIK